MTTSVKSCFSKKGLVGVLHVRLQNVTMSVVLRSEVNKVLVRTKKEDKTINDGYYQLRITESSCVLQRRGLRGCRVLI